MTTQNEQPSRASLKVTPLECAEWAIGADGGTLSAEQCRALRLELARLRGENLALREKLEDATTALAEATNSASKWENLYQNPSAVQVFHATGEPNIRFRFDANHKLRHLRRIEDFLTGMGASAHLTEAEWVWAFEMTPTQKERWDQWVQQLD